MKHNSFKSILNLKRPIIRETLIILTIFIVVELLVRSLVTFNILVAPYGEWHRPKFPIILFEAEHLQPDVFFVGNSITRHGVVPKVFNVHYYEQTHKTIKTYNAGISGIPAEVTSTFTSEFLIQDFDVNTIIWILRAGDIDTYLSQNWQEQWSTFLEVPEVQNRTNSQFSIDGIGKYWWTWRFRSTLKYIATRMSRPFSYELQERLDYGYKPLAETILPEEMLGQNFDWQYYSRQIDSNVLDIIANFLQVASDNNVRVIFVIPPTLNHYYQGSADYTSVENNIIDNFKAFAKLHKVSVYDERYLSYDDIITFGQFTDSIHLNQNGAPIFTKRLVEIYIQETTDN